MNIDNKDIEAEIALFGNEADAFDNDEEYHSKNLSTTELMKKTAERSYYIDLVDNYSGKTIRIYVDRHDYLLYKRPIWSAWKKEQLEKRCLIPAKNSEGYKRCMGDCSTCSRIKHGGLFSLEAMKESYNFEPKADNFFNPCEQAFFSEAVDLLWSLIRQVSTEEQFNKIRLYYKDGLTLEQVAKIYGVSHKAIEKTIKNTLHKLSGIITEEQKSFLFQYLVK